MYFGIHPPTLAEKYQPGHVLGQAQACFGFSQTHAANFLVVFPQTYLFSSRSQGTLSRDEPRYPPAFLKKPAKDSSELLSSSRIPLMPPHFPNAGHTEFRFSELKLQTINLVSCAGQWGLRKENCKRFVISLVFPFAHSFPTEARFLFYFVLFYFFPNFLRKILTNGSPDSYQQKFGLF